ncbi:PAS domain-containing sensor histidine kinase [Bacillus sp. M6-12]|uniref:PAS domain S-box protein n=1 Tax=Bacillus sp. M6-12 TaxID=2054166 RepID=UPI000C783201|nr:PAS domain S-box protein [Bacillus sp. M6-12]PLS16437.1 PAS domain-containing sensor histidine kinase [Bacillus sp. M6-12]
MAGRAGQETTDNLKELELLRKQLSFYHDFFENVAEAAVMVDSKKQITHVNKAALSLFEMAREELLAYKITDFLHEVPPHILQYQEEMIIKEGNFTDEWILRLPNGIVKHVEFKSFDYPYEGYTIYKIKDITLERTLERERTISVQMFQDVFHQAVDSILIFDRDGVIVDVNPAFCHSIQMSKLMVIGGKIQNLLTLESVPVWIESLKEVEQTGSSAGQVEVEIKRNKLRFEYTTSSNIFNGLYMSIFRNVTEKYMMESKLKKSEEIFGQLFELAIDAIVFSDENGIITRVNNSACKIFESTREELLGTHVAKYTDRLNKEYRNLISEFIETGSVRGELFFTMPNGQVKLLELTANSHPSEGYNIIIFRNVSERWRIEDELRKSEKKFRKIFERTMDGIILWNKEKIEDINENGVRIFEINKEKLLAWSIQEILKMVPENTFALQSYMEEVQSSQEQLVTIPITFPDGRVKHIEFSTRPFLSQELHLTLFRDITEKLEMEEQLRKSDTLSVVGELAAGIAHEIRNPMTALKGFIQLLQSSVKEDFSTYFNVITSELQRIESIITEFLVLAKPQAMNYQERNINGVMQDTLDLLAAQALMQNIQFDTDFQENPFIIYCEGNQLKQVFINIIKNAIEVMANGGVIHISSKRYRGNFVKISIKDQGMGIPEKKIKKLGEPFYTTKERGTGLGLMVSYKIIEEHNGCIEVESEIGVGTTFHIYLPVNKEENKFSRE